MGGWPTCGLWLNRRGGLRYCTQGQFLENCYTLGCSRGHGQSHVASPYGIGDLLWAFKVTSSQMTYFPSAIRGVLFWALFSTGVRKYQLLTKTLRIVFLP